MEYEITEDTEERRQEMQRFYKFYDAVRQKYGLTMSAHASIFDDCWIRIWQGKGMAKKLVIKVENESETQCYHVATEALTSWIANKEDLKKTQKVG